MQKESLNINSFAKLAGVSTTTVSNYINDTGSFPISKEKEELLRKLMRQTGYRPNSSSTLIRRKKQLPPKGIFIYGDYVKLSSFHVIQNPTIIPLLDELSLQVKDKFGADLEVRSIADEDSLEQWNEVLIGAEFVINYGQLDPQLNKLCWRKNIPLILISASHETRCRNGETLPQHLDHVYWDNGVHLDMSIDFLRECGATNILYISSVNVLENHPQYCSTDAQARLDGFRNYLKCNQDISGSTLIPHDTKEKLPEGAIFFWEQQNASQKLQLQPELLCGVDAIIGHNDFVASGAVSALLLMGRRPGRDVLVIGEGNMRELAYHSPGITTVSVQFAKLVSEVCRILRSRMDGDDPQRGERILVPGELIERETTEKIST